MPIQNKTFLYRLEHEHTLSIKRLHQAIQQILIKHSALRTSLVFHAEQNLFLQRIIDFSKNDSFAYIKSTFQTDEQLNDIISDERLNPRHFDLAQGRVFRCHLVYYKQVSSNDLLSGEDVLIFNFHHAVFDNSSMDIFLEDLNKAYNTGELETNDDNSLRYLDCKCHSRISSSSFQNHHFSSFVI